MNLSSCVVSRLGILGYCLLCGLSSLRIGAQPEYSPCGSHAAGTALKVWESRMAPVKSYFDPGGYETEPEDVRAWEVFLESDSFRRAEDFQEAIMFFQQLTKVPSGLDTAVGYIATDPRQLQAVVLRWEAWRDGRKPDQKSRLLICLVDRNIKSMRGYRKPNSVLRDLFGDLWISFGNTLSDSLEEHGTEVQRHSVSVARLDPYGGFSLLQWELESRSASAVGQAFDRPPDTAALGLWALKEDALLSVRFFFLEGNFSNRNDDQRPAELVDELTWAEEELSFLGIRFARVSSELNDVPVWRRISRLRTENERSLLWLR
jgi:hypothetical protein